MAALTGGLPWPLGLAAAVAAGLLLYVVAARLRLRPASGAAAVALFSAAVVLVEWYAPLGVDGRGALLLGLAACVAVGGRVRGLVAVVACAGAVVVAPVAAVALLVLLGWMALTGGVVRRGRVATRWVLAGGAFLAALAVPVVEFRPDPGPALPPVVLAILSVWALLLVGLLWTRLVWLRPVAVATVATAACTWVPGPDADAAVLVAAAVAVLSVLLAEELRVLLARRVLIAVVAATAAATVLLAPAGSGSAPVGTMSVASAPTPSFPDAVRDTVRARVRPLTIAIPALGVTGPLGELTADPVTAELAAPDDPAQAGWFATGVVPGERGPAVVGGHVDSRAGPGVFAELGTLRPGDLVEITRSDRRTVRFTVTAVRSFPKEGFPTEAVYGPAPGPELRLVTCGGRFDRDRRSYEDNVVVDAVLA